jgi:hypothetical protein
MGTEEEIRNLQIIQNRVMRLILKKGPRTSVEWMLSTLQIMSVKQRVYLGYTCLDLQNEKSHATQIHV